MLLRRWWTSSATPCSQEWPPAKILSSYAPKRVSPSRSSTERPRVCPKPRVTLQPLAHNVRSVGLPRTEPLRHTSVHGDAPCNALTRRGRDMGR